MVTVATIGALVRYFNKYCMGQLCLQVDVKLHVIEGIL